MTFIEDPVVVLTEEEMDFADLIGRRREGQHDKDEPHKHGFVGDGLENHIRGARGELAVAKYLGVYWNGNVGKTKLPDVGPYQMRAGSQPSHRLILHKTDKDEDIAILPTGPAPQFHIRGWCYCREGKLQKYWEDPVGKRAAFFVPQRALRPIVTLPTEPLRKWLRERPGFYSDVARSRTELETA